MIKKLKITRVSFKKTSKYRIKIEVLKTYVKFFFYFLKKISEKKKFLENFYGYLNGHLVEFEVASLFLRKKILFISMVFFPTVFSKDENLLTEKKNLLKFHLGNFDKCNLTFFWIFFFRILNQKKNQNLKKLLLIAGKKLPFPLLKKKSIFKWFQIQILNLLRYSKKKVILKHSLGFLKNFFSRIQEHQKFDFLERIWKVAKFGKSQFFPFFRQFLVEIFSGVSLKRTLEIGERILEYSKESCKNLLEKQPNPDLEGFFGILRTLDLFLFHRSPLDISFLFNLKTFFFWEKIFFKHSDLGVSFDKIKVVVEFFHYLNKHNSRTNKFLFIHLIIKVFKKRKIVFFPSKLFQPSFPLKIEKIIYSKNPNIFQEDPVKSYILMKNFENSFASEEKFRFHGKIQIKHQKIRFYLLSSSFIKTYFHQKLC